MQKRTMVWNTQKKIWEYSTEDRLFGQWEPFLGTWPTSGMMQDGQAYELQMQEHLTTDSEFLSLPTPTTQDGKNTAGPSQFDRNTKPLNVEAVILMRTPQVDDSKNTGHNQDRRSTLASQVWETERKTNWGKFEPAIRRWEEVLGRPAPAPTKPDGKDGAHRLSSSFTEWMMGLESGWVTDAGLTRNQELKACGNGVVPQQAEMALRILLESISPDWREMLEETNIVRTSDTKKKE